MKSRCVGCGGLFDPKVGAIHDYMLSSATCWEQYGHILAREYQNQNLFVSSHRLTVDAYALQHPGLENERRAYQSVRIHYVSLHLIFACGKTHLEATDALKTLSNQSFNPLPSRPSGFKFTVKDVFDSELTNHEAEIEKWARCAYESWSVLRHYAEEVIQESRLL